ncbi:MAG: PASTA domain-containing protein [Gemmatimonadaceae bacterium]|nr:PASTA domain-containing protein [Gemmatimonadaceae bacterium]
MTDYPSMPTGPGGQHDHVDANAGGADRNGQNTPTLAVSRGRSTFVHLTLVLFGAALVARAAHVQIIEHGHWQTVAASQHVRDEDVEPVRGAIVDATGTVLVETREQVRIIVEPHHLKPVTRKRKNGKRETVDTRAVLRRGLRELQVSDAWIKRALDRQKKWVELPHRFASSDVERLKGLPGVALKPVLTRINSTPSGLRGVVGALDPQGDPVSGIELELDPWLHGERGHSPLVRDGRGGRIESPMLQRVEAQPGHTVTLTINQSLQEIAEEALADARDRTGASGGDVVIVDPRDGAVLALAGVRDGKPAYNSTPIAEAYEPGSVMKPFVVARLLDAGRTTPTEVINTENGKWLYANRTLSDEHKAASMSVFQIIQYSSNIGTAKLGLRFSPREAYEAMRDFGFGSYSGVSYPAESRGALALPSQWQEVTRTRVPIGYGMSATPLQIASAYVALANGGELLQPSLVREVHARDGRLLYRHRRTVVRRVVTEETAESMRTMLKSVVDSGTAQAADLGTFDVGGKSGTARRVVGGRYESGRYNASFAGMFPANDPQYVIVARLIDPRGTYFGGIVSGGMVNRILQAAIATRDASLDRDALARVARPTPAPPPKPRTPEQVRIATRDSLRRDSLLAPRPRAPEPVAAPAMVVVDLPHAADAGRKRSDESRELRTVPSVYGLDARQATLTLHQAGFQVSVVNGATVRTRPAAGASLRSGATVQLEVPKQ